MPINSQTEKAIAKQDINEKMNSIEEADDQEKEVKVNEVKEYFKEKSKLPHRESAIQYCKAGINLLLDNHYDGDNYFARELFNLVYQDNENINSDRIDILKFLAEHAHEPSVEKLFELACDYVKDEINNSTITGNSEEAETILRLLVLSEQKKDESLKVLEIIGDNYQNKKELEKAADLFENLINESFNQDILCSKLCEIARIYQNNNDEKKANKLFKFLETNNYAIFDVVQRDPIKLGENKYGLFNESNKRKNYDKDEEYSFEIENSEIESIELEIENTAESESAEELENLEESNTYKLNK